MAVKADKTKKAKTVKKTVASKSKPIKKAAKKKSVISKKSAPQKTNNLTAITPIIYDSGLDFPSLKNLNSKNSPLHPERVWPD